MNVVNLVFNPYAFHMLTTDPAIGFKYGTAIRSLYGIENKMCRRKKMSKSQRTSVSMDFCLRVCVVTENTRPTTFSIAKSDFKRLYIGKGTTPLFKWKFSFCADRPVDASILNDGENVTSIPRERARARSLANRNVVQKYPFVFISWAYKANRENAMKLYPYKM